MTCFDLIIFGLIGPIGSDKTKIYKFLRRKADEYSYDINKEIILKDYLERITPTRYKKNSGYPAKYYENLMNVANKFREAKKLCRI